MQVNDYNDIDRINHINEIYTESFPIWTTTKEKIAQITQTYHCTDLFNIQRILIKMHMRQKCSGRITHAH